MTGQQCPTFHEVIEAIYLSDPQNRAEDYEGPGDIGWPTRRAARAVLALFPQPTPSAGRDRVVVTRDQIENGVREVFADTWPEPDEAPAIVIAAILARSRYLRDAASPSIADMAPKTTFTASLISEQKVRRFAVPDPLFRWWVTDTATTLAYAVGGIDPSTIRDVTPPPAAPEVN